MPPSALLVVAVVALAGVAVGTQAPLNAELGRSIGSGIGAAAVSFFVGFLVLTIASIVTGGSGSLAAAFGAPPRLLIGGVFGAFFVWAMLWSVPLVGVVSATAALILGQMTAGLIFDAIGAFGLPKQPIAWNRVAAVAMVAFGLVLSRL